MTSKAKIELRCSEKEKNIWKIKSKIHGFKSLSEFIRYCLENYDLKERYKKRKVKNGN